MALCSIIIPVYNRASITRQCLNALLMRPPAVSVDTEIIVVDDASSDYTPQVLENCGDQVRVVRNHANSGFATACNNGATVAYGDYLVFLNNDTMPQLGWLDALVLYATSHVNAAIVGSKLLFPNDTVQHAGVAFFPKAVPIQIYYGFPSDHPAVNKSRRFQAVTAACMLVRRDVFHDLGGFDTAYTNVFEDADLCLRAGERGYEVHYCAESVLCHLESLTRRPSSTMRDPLGDVQQSVRIFESRWADRVESDVMQYLMEDGLVALVPAINSSVQVWVSPMLGLVNRDDYDRAADRIISDRARQGRELLDENLRLKARLEEIELQLLAGGSERVARPLTWPGLRSHASFFDVRNYVAGLYLHGAGIEIGALHSPIEVRPPATVRYVDRLSVGELRRQYPELDDRSLVEPDIIDDGERLESIESGSQDFVIASHFLEHCEDPIGAIKAMLRVTKVGGFVYLAVPDKRYTFDHARPVTSFEHVLRDHTDGPGWSRAQHFDEWVTLGEDANTRSKTACELMDMNYSIHFHVWTQAELLELFASLKTRLALEFEIEAMVTNAIEVIVVLRKTVRTV